MARPYEVLIHVQDLNTDKIRSRRWSVPVGIVIDNARLVPVATWLIDAILELDNESGVDDL